MSSLRLRARSHTRSSFVAVVFCASLFAACGDDTAPPPEADAGAVADARVDAPFDIGTPDLSSCVDDDGDGHRSSACGGDDCDDANASRYPTATEMCDTDDEDCNDATFGADSDSDGFESSGCCNGPDNCGADCNDLLNTVNPSASEVCNGGIDDDCDGLADGDDSVCVPCGPGFTGLDRMCVDNDECLMGVCGAAVGTTCDNMPGTYECTCPVGYTAPGSGGTCADVDECAADTCGLGDSSCANLTGTYACTCLAGFVAATTTGAPCLRTDPSLTALVPSVGTLSPVFASATTTYQLTLPVGTSSVTLRPSVAYPTLATITVNGVVVASDAASAAVVVVGRVPVPVTVVVTTETGATRTYTVIVARGSTYVKASNTGGAFGVVALSSDGSTLAVGAPGESSNATGIGGNQADNTAPGAGAVYVFIRVGTTWSQQAYIKASNTDPYDSFGGSVSLSSDGSTLAVGAVREQSNATGINGNQADNSHRFFRGGGAAYVFTRLGTVWSQQAYIKASNTGEGDGFGTAVSLSGDGSRLAVGAPFEESNATGVGGDQADDSTQRAGAVYVFARTAMTWSQQAYIKASNTGLGDTFGSAVSLSSDGSTLAVGAAIPFGAPNYGESSNATGIDGDQSNGGARAAGAVYVFTRLGMTWSQQAYIKASNTGELDGFGYTVALSSDGSTLAVGAPREGSNATGVGGVQTDNSAQDAGAVYVFTRVGTTWSQQAYVKASNTDTGDQFGFALSLSSDGSTLAVGAVWEASIATGIGGDQANNSALYAGAVYVFTRLGTTWSQQAYVKASNTSFRVGAFVALSADGTTLAVGAPGEASNATGIDGDQTNNSAGGSGAVYVY